MSSHTQPGVPDALQQALELFKRKREELMGEVRDLMGEVRKIDETIANFGSNGNAPAAPPVEIPPVIPGQYKGMRMSVALESYLKARPGMTIPIDKVVDDLRVAGAEMGLMKRHRQNLRITMQARKQLVEWDSDERGNAIALRLAPTANEPPKPRKIRKKA